MDALPDSRESGVLGITPAMLEAGVDLLTDWESDYYAGPDVTPSATVARIFSSMALKAITSA